MTEIFLLDYRCYRSESLKAFWTYFGHVLGHVLGKFWGRSGHVLGVLWTCVGDVLGVFSGCFGHILALEPPFDPHQIWLGSPGDTLPQPAKARVPSLDSFQTIFFPPMILK